ncbi:unnamed protein product [Ectocarpus sp. 8 AP-2014]
MSQLAFPPTGIYVLMRFGWAGKHVWRSTPTSKTAWTQPAARGKVDLNRTAGQGTHSGVIGRNRSSASQSQRARSMVWRATKAHVASARQDLSERQLLGEDRLHEDFVAQGRHAGSTARRERHRPPPGQ